MLRKKTTCHIKAEKITERHTYGKTKPMGHWCFTTSGRGDDLRVDLPFYGSKSSKIWVIWVRGRYISLIGQLLVELVGSSYF